MNKIAPRTHFTFQSEPKYYKIDILMKMNMYICILDK